MTLANIISLSRIAVLPIIGYFIFQNIYPKLVLVLLILALISDGLDGYIARKRKEVTKIGSFLDPFSDKILLVGLLLIFYYQGEFWLIPLLIFIARDLISGRIRWLASQDDVTIPQGVMTKLVLVSQFTIIFSILLRGIIPVYEYLWEITLLAVIISILSIVYVSVIYWNGFRKAKSLGEKLQEENLVILANKKSSGYKNSYRRRLLRIFAERRNASLIYLPKKGDMFNGVEKKVGQKDQIIIAGGDGSFESALNHTSFQNRSLGFFPLGRGNAFYSYFYRGKRFEYLRSRFNFHETEIDVLELEWGGKKLQTMFMAIGVDAEVVRFSTDRLNNDFFDYFKGAIRVIKKSKADFNLDVTIDGKKHLLTNCVNFTLAKVPYYGFSLRSIIGKVLPNDKKVYGLAVISPHHKFFNKMIRLWGLFLSSMALEKNPLLSLKGKTFVVKSDEKFPIQAGGEFLGFTKKIKVKVLRKQKVLVI